MADTASRSYLVDLRDTRALAQKLWSQCRDSPSAYSSVAGDLRRLRNALEDIEEHIHDNVLMESQSRKVFNQVSKCKAILGGLDLGLQSFRCSNKQLDVQPEAIAAIKASVQVATDGLLMIYHGLSGTVNYSGLQSLEFPAAGIRRLSIASAASSNGISITQSVATEENMTLSNSARIFSVGWLPSEQHGSHTQDAVETLQTPPLRRKAPAQSLNTVSWRKPFTPPDPLSYDDSKAFTLLTGRRDQAVADGSRPKGETPGEIATHETIARANALGTLFSFDSRPSRQTWNGSPRRWIGSPRPSRACSGPELRQPGLSPDATPTMAYLPYRPWYSSEETPTVSAKLLLRRDSVADLSGIQSSRERQQNGHGLPKRRLAVSTRPNTRPTPVICVTDYSTAVKHHDGVAVMDKPAQIDDTSSKPDRPPSSPTLEAKKAPSTTHPQRFYHITNASPPNESTPTLSEHAATSSPEDSPTLASLILRVKSRPEDIWYPGSVASSTDESASLNTQHRPRHRRASTGGIDNMSFRLDLMKCGADDPLRTPRPSFDQMTHSLSQNALCVSSRSSCVNMTLPRSRSISAPELRTPKPRPTQLPHAPIHTSEQSSLSYEPPDLGRSSAESSVLKEVANSTDANLEETRLEHICSNWNSRQWAKAESYLMQHLSTLEAPGSHNSARRVFHLLGVCASYRGQWGRALAWFLSVVTKPVEDAQALDAGDRAAFYWLGDIYAILNRKEEALLSYCLAGSCNQSQPTDSRPRSSRCLLADQETLRGMVSKATFKVIWAHERFHSCHAADGEMFHASIVSQAAAQTRLQHFGRSANDCLQHTANHGPNPSLPSLNALLITPSTLHPTSPFPLPHDPLFSLPSVSRGRLTTQDLDLLAATRQHPGTLLPRKTLSPDRMSGFTSENMPNLISTLRETLRTLAMGWSEIVTAKGMFFKVRYNVVLEGVASTNYFALEAIRMPLRAGYGLAFCSESLCGARMLDSAHATTTKPKNRIKSVSGSLSSLNLSNLSILSSTPPTSTTSPSNTEKELKSCLRTTLRMISIRHREAAGAGGSSSPPCPPPKSLPSSSNDTTPTGTALSIPELPTTTPENIRMSSSSAGDSRSIAHDISTLIPPVELGKLSPLGSNPA